MTEAGSVNVRVKIRSHRIRPRKDFRIGTLRQARIRQEGVSLRVLLRGWTNFEIKRGDRDSTWKSCHILFILQNPHDFFYSIPPPKTLIPLQQHRFSSIFPPVFKISVGNLCSLRIELDSIKVFARETHHRSISFLDLQIDPSQSMAPKRSRNQASSSVADEEPKQWRSKPLSTLPKQWQPILYCKKLQGVKDIKDIIVAERTTKLEDFRYFGLYEGFERLGWLAALTINDEKEESRIYLDEIVEWMSTLERDEGENPPWTTKLTGTVKGVPVVLSRATLRQIADFDTLPEEEYEKVTDSFIRGDLRTDGWVDMLRELFEVPENQLSETMKLDEHDLKPLPRLIMKIFMWNIVPRKSDKGKLRGIDIRALYAIVTGRIKFPFSQLLMINVWDSHENSKRMTVPHCRVLSELLIRANAIGRNAKPKIIAFKRFDRAHFTGKEFAFTETVTQFCLHDQGKKRVQRFLKPPGYNERREGRPLDVEDEFENYGANAPSQPYPGRPQVYQDWDTYQRMMWDYNHYQWEEQRQRDREAEQRRAQCEERMEERMTQLEDNMMRVRQDGEIRGYYQQKYHHDLYDWTEQQRHWHDFTNQREYQQHVPRQDFASMMRDDGSGPSHPPPHFPEMNHPEWWPGEYRSHQGAGTSTSHHRPKVQDPFDTRDLTRSLHESMFGPDR